MSQTYSTPNGKIVLTSNGAVYGGRPERHLGWVRLDEPEGKYTGETVDGKSKVFDTMPGAVNFVAASA